MNRPMQASRPAQMPGNRPSMPYTTQRPSIGAGQGVTPGVANRGPAPAQSFNRPSSGQVSNFLNMPQGPQGGARSTGAPAPRQSSTGDGFQSKTFTTAGGSTITIGGGSGSGTTAGGATVGGAGAAIKVEGAGGNTFVKGSGAVGASKGDASAVAGGSRTGIESSSGAAAARGTGFRAASDGTNSAVRAGSATGARDAAGNSIANVRGGYADSSGYRQGASLTAARNQWGYTGVSGRAGYGAGGTGQVGAIGGIRGPGGNVVTAGRGAAFVNGQFVGGQAWSAVNGAYTRWGVFTPGWYGGYPGAWWPGKWALATTAWATAAWATCGSYCGCSGEGAYYDYGENVTYDDGTVYYGDQAVATDDQYYASAEQLAASGSQPQNDEWLPLGVFAVLTEPTQTQADRVVQLAVNKEGIIRGNLQDALTDKVIPVTGAVDKTTQRVSMKLEGVEKMIVETGLYNLTNDEVPVMVHQGPDRQESRTLIRLVPPESSEQPKQQ
jgi:hypothetical protein